MKITCGTIVLIAAVCFPVPGISQNDQPAANATAPQPQEQTVEGSFCKNDSRSEIRAFCGDLTTFQTHVSAKPASTIKELKTDLDFLDLSNSHAAENITNALAVSLALTSALQTVEQSRLDKQLGAPGNASGTTSLISKAGSADLLSLALDTGALTRSVNGATSTLSTNADQLFRLITGHNPDCMLTLVPGGCGSLGWFESYVLNRTNILATFALAQQSSTSTSTSGQASGTTPTQVSSAAIPAGAGKLSSISARYEVINKFDPRSTQFQQKLNSVVDNNRPALTDAATKALAALFTVISGLKASATPLDDTAREKLLQAAQSDTSGKALLNTFESYYSVAVAAVVKADTFTSAVGQVTQYQTVYQNLWRQAIDQAAGTLFTASYTYNKPLNQPNTHDLTLILGFDRQDYGMLTFNGAISLYAGALPSGAKYGRIHDGQISGEYDRTLTGKSGRTQTQLSLAGYWQYQPNPSVLNIPAGTVAPGTTIPIPNGTQEFVGTAGSLWVAQAKITIKASKGINIPLGVSWSNKTDLLQGNKVGAQVGISYDFSSLAGLFTGGGGQ